MRGRKEGEEGYLLEDDEGGSSKRERENEKIVFLEKQTKGKKNDCGKRGGCTRTLCLYRAVIGGVVSVNLLLQSNGLYLFLLCFLCFKLTV